jgi:hypothetical protein
MARSSSHESRRNNSWAVDQKPRSMPRVVRLGRAANDNIRRTNLKARLFIVTLATTLAMVAMYHWRLL